MHCIRYRIVIDHIRYCKVIGSSCIIENNEKATLPIRMLYYTLSYERKKIDDIMYCPSGSPQRLILERALSRILCSLMMVMQDLDPSSLLALCKFTCMFFCFVNRLTALTHCSSMFYEIE